MANYNTVKPSDYLSVGPARTSFMQVYEPKADKKGNMKYGTVLLVPKTELVIVDHLRAELKKFLELRWPNAADRPRKMPVKDGDVPNGNNNIPAGYAGCYVINTISKNQPELLDERLLKVVDRRKFYSGCWVNAIISFFEYSQDGNRGIGCGLTTLQFVRNDKALGGGAPPDAKKFFQPVPGSQAAAGAPADNGDSADGFLN